MMSDTPTGTPAGSEPLAQDNEDDLEVQEAEDEPEVDAEAPVDEADADVDGEQGQTDEGQTQRQARDVGQRRGSPRVQNLVNENRELKARLSTFEQQLQTALQQRQQPSPAELAAQQEAERQRYEMMSPWEQAQYLQDNINRRVTEQTTQIAQSLWDQSDRREYEALVADNPAYKALEDRVADLKRQAPGVPRRILLATAIGMRAMERGPAAGTRQRRNADVALERNRVRPTRPQGDVPRNAGRADDLEERLRNTQI
jgi:hypothetical protein